MVVKGQPKLKPCNMKGEPRISRLWCGHFSDLENGGWMWTFTV